ncbi:MAG: GNAT family N-acetyltransferase [Chloroflexi bacterium]|nr:GNAT family N-acetyltransferase [Chloroflexota bacterium]
MAQKTQILSDIRILPASLWDLNQLRVLERICFSQDAWPLIEMMGVLTFPSVERWKAVDGETLAGFVAADIRRTQNLAWIATIAVHPDYRRRGLGDQLMGKVESLVGVGRMRLSARAGNREAIALYQRRGYEQIDVWPAYYRGAEDAVVMEKEL